jgi:hypothetical protein
MRASHDIGDDGRRCIGRRTPGSRNPGYRYIFFNMTHPFFGPILRLRVTPDEPEAPDAFVGGPRVRGSKRPHADAKCAQVRRLIETTVLTYGEIAKQTGVGRASICRWTRDGGWQRPLFAPRATDTVPSARASQKLKLRKLAERLHALAERAVRELEAQPDVDIDRLMQALQVLKMARLEAMGRRRPRRQIDMPARTGREMMERDAAIRTALKEMRRGGVDVTQISDDAMALLEAAHTPPERDHPALRPRGSRRR